MSKSLTEAAKAVLEGKVLEEGAYPEVSPGKISNPNPVDPSTVNTVNAKTLHPGTKSPEGRFANPNGPDVASLSGVEDLGGATPTSVASDNLGSKAAGKTGKDTSKSSRSSVAPEAKKSLKGQPAMAEEMEEEGEVVAETNAIAERVATIKEAAKKSKMKKDDDDDDSCMEEELELSEELEDFINEAIEAGLDEEEILTAIDENFEFISEEEELDEDEDYIYEISQKLATTAYGLGASDGWDDHPSHERLGKHIERKFGRKASDNAEKHAYSPNRSSKQQMSQAEDPLRTASKSSNMRKTKSGKIHKQDVEAKKGEIKWRRKYDSIGKKVNLPEGYDLDEDYYDALEQYPVDMSEHVNALLEGENLSEDFHAKATTIFEAAVKAKLEEEVALLEQAYAETLEERVAEIMEELSTNVDNYLNYVVEQWIEENEVAVESALRSELTEDFISGLRSLFAEHYIDIPEEEVAVVEELSQTVEELEAKLNEEIERNVALTGMIAESRKNELVAYVCEGLTTTQSEKLKGLVENVAYTDDDQFIEKISTLRENYFPSAVKTDLVLDRVESADPKMISESTLEGPMAKYVQALGRNLPK